MSGREIEGFRICIQLSVIVVCNLLFVFLDFAFLPSFGCGGAATYLKIIAFHPII